MTTDSGGTRDEPLSISMKVSPAERRMLEVLLAREKERAGRYASSVTKAGMLRQWFLEAAAAQGLTPDMFKDGPAPETPPPPAAATGAPAPAVPPPDSHATPTEENRGPTPAQVRAALERALGAGLSMSKIAEEAEMQRPRIGEFRRGTDLPFGNEQLPQLAATLARLGYGAR